MNYFYSESGSRRALLSTLWIFVLINMLFRDVHEFLRPGVITDIASSFMLELQIAMIVLSRILSESFNRWANFFVASFSMLFILAVPNKELNDIFFAVIQFIGLIAILWFGCIQPFLSDLISCTRLTTRP